VLKLRILSRHQQLIRLDFEDGFPGFDPARVKGRLAERLAGAGAVVLSDYGKGALAAVPELVATARAAGVPVLVDPKGADFGRYRGASAITPNLAELQAVVGPCPDEATLVAKAERLRRELELEALLVTRSERGMTLLRAGREPLHLPAQAREVYDVTGAGDTVVAALAAGLAAGLDWPEATALANLAAGIVVGKLGTATVSVPELRRAVSELTDTHRGVVSEAELLQAVADARAHGERIVMTNGCFDILHAGHVAYLQQARRLGDRLVEDRCAVLAALGCVDWVVPFSEDTPERLICRVRPDVLVKGGDYRSDEIAGAACVRAAGGEVVVLDYVEGVSTSGIIARVRDGAAR